MASDLNRDPERWLRQAEAEEVRGRRGRLKVFLGYAGGVGKSFRMLDEGRRRHERGEDVVVGAVQEQPTQEVENLLSKLEVIPLRKAAGTPAMDVEVILHRHPEVCLVDALACDNPPGSRNPKRWQDVEQLLGSGISVITTVNLQYIEELQDKVERIIGRRPKEAVPQSFLSTAEEIEVVDAPPEMALQRTGDAAEPREVTERREGEFSELRELALLLAAEVVDHQLESYLRGQGIEQSWGTQERILVWVPRHSDAVALISSGKRNADRFQGELVVAYFREPDLAANEASSLEKNLALARASGARIETLDAEDHVDAVMRCAQAYGITQIFVKRSTEESLWDRLFGSPIDRLIQAAEGMDVRVFPR